ncbi:uncharacterized protein B0P05DRAFT_580421 [Gilbertella persicaria]|uniref:uncharacterized protein n=1 Tax=Gilbertella persicaria TaxID=101096 RepID=UPI00221F6AFD|nr:uncharacterized protein B0P05DRAFT_580421 [Gilbertella persicaria]KAI8070544.1 hypothetical protein B0P05DRAFT_580421 [Gilbertella persicaria]
MMNSLIGARNNHLDFNILFYPQYQDERGQVVCYPGSVFEGIVQVKVGVPIPVHHIKLVFKASERVNYDAMGWEKSKLTDDRLFAVRTVLWGLPTGIDIPVSAWPVLEAGEHTFPFVCQMPVINFPPTFHHHLIATAFNMIVSLEKANEPSPILSKPFPVYFQPIIETVPIKNLHAFTEETKLTNHITAHVSVPRLAYNINDKNQSILVTANFQSDLRDEQSLNMSQLRVYIKRYYNINYKTFSRNEATIITHYDHPKLPSSCPSTVTMKLSLPANPTELPATLTYSPHLTVEYKLVVVAKVRHGPIHVKKKLFDMPIMFGTLPAGTRAPRQLEPYSAIVENRSTINSKPQFIRPEPRGQGEEEFLPPYDSDSVPPAYNNLINGSLRTASSPSLRIQIC